ncbi:MAG: methylenetetrahydrofolate--tRNA-(uracil(54)-C(5))-methyltransferase (FADH(2)-oxidizing) TrmFO [SAR324 cluster bacterium]|uniref:Methylenetetrahydrofolate--tRNA-(uracil-5-)-methyltransferase TrmFO n=1 Tax=SAR324 cluster bacterium TaxID=2024889 RepID=A0A2A4T7I3_9DELT|nr:MAG: methylenetetrahydrofolate--tRNA-(uracil(54)-C(5))-methyltransferase (FADH(2)-oxidizing) TrmFO [SAR324 cluster bacterium]
MSDTPQVAVIGAGLAGCEAAWQLARKGVSVTLFEMRPETGTAVHKTGNFAELVCSNSFKSLDTGNAHGLLKDELEKAGSLIVQCAKESAVPAGSALAVDRENFSQLVRGKLLALGNVDFQAREIRDLQELQKQFSHIIVATGPLSSDALADSLKQIIEEDELFFYDAIAPVVFTESINMEIAYLASRYGKGTADYINCPMNRDEYYQFIEDLNLSEKVPFTGLEQAKHFEGCLPIEVMAERGAETLSFGPMKPVGLEDPRTGRRPYAVLQLRQENQLGTLYNLVGCQTRMTWPEQKKVFRKIPGLENCEFARHGSMHRNTYINAPRQLQASLELRKAPGIYLAGQITGVEGYTESTSMGLWAAMNVIADLEEKEKPQPSLLTMIGGLVNYLQTASSQNFQPMNSNFGLLTSPPKQKRIKKKEKRALQAQQAQEIWAQQLKEWEWME